MLLPLEKLKKLAAGGYEVKILGNEVEVSFPTPTLADAASHPELGVERRQFVVRGVVERDVVRLVEAYVEEPTGKRHVDLKDLELWVEYIKNL
ncbi:MAG: hypothetical protein ACK4M3_06960 [Pyrobaculum sp.]